MKATINIQEDEKLRKEIRAMIKGQVVSITREEIKAMIIETLGSNSKKLDIDSLERMAQSQVRDAVKLAVNETSYSNDLKKLDKMIRIEIAKILEEMKPRIMKMVSSAVKAYIGELTEAKINDEIVTENDLADVAKDRSSSRMTGVGSDTITWNP